MKSVRAEMRNIYRLKADENPWKYLDEHLWGCLSENMYCNNINYTSEYGFKLKERLNERS